MAMGFARDEKRALLVMTRDETSLDADYALLVENMDKLDAAAVAQKLSAVAIIVTVPETPTPPAHWRGRFAEAAKRTQAKKTYVGLVTSSSLQRGVLTAISWLSGNDARMNMGAYPTFEEACLAAERLRGGRLLELAGLREAALDDQRLRTRTSRAG